MDKTKIQSLAQKNLIHYNTKLKLKKSLNMPQCSSARNLAHQAILYWEQGKGFIEDFFHGKQEPIADTRTLALAQEIAYGTVRMKKYLDYLAVHGLHLVKMPKKIGEKTLLRIALYQICFLESIPQYAIVHESVEIAKKMLNTSFARFLNATLRKANKQDLLLILQNPQTLEELAAYYSYPLYFVQKVIEHFGKEKAIDILKHGNSRPIHMARIRPHSENCTQNPLQHPHEKITVNDGIEMLFLNDPLVIQQVGKSRAFYIQNKTPVQLFLYLKKSLLNSPQLILDLCAAPGGKIALAHDCFPQAELVVNDPSEARIAYLTHNLNRLNITASVSCKPGQFFSYPHAFDLVILDVPCSNSGVLNKRPEARWRLSNEHTMQLQNIQKALLENACKLISSTGRIWYMTCSLLKEENEELITYAYRHLNLTLDADPLLIVPDQEGGDGGFGCSFKRKTDLTEDLLR